VQGNARQARHVHRLAQRLGGLQTHTPGRGGGEQAAGPGGAAAGRPSDTQAGEGRGVSRLRGQGGGRPLGGLQTHRPGRGGG
jgi:hypothetical protein